MKALRRAGHPLLNKNCAVDYAPEKGYPSVADMRAFANDNDFEVEAAGNFSCNPQKVVMLTRGHYIVIVDMWDKDRKKSEHACALTENDGEMFLVDNIHERSCTPTQGNARRETT